MTWLVAGLIMSREWMIQAGWFQAGEHWKCRVAGNGAIVNGEGPLAAGSLAGLKRRTRATMGRCQGFYCSAELSEMTAGAFDDFSADHKS